MELYTEEGRRAYAAEAAKHGAFSLETAARLVADNQSRGDAEHIDGELLAAIEAQLAPDIPAVFFVDRAFHTLASLVAAHPGLRGKNPQDFFERLEVGVLLERELKVGKYFRGKNADRRATIARYETRVVDPPSEPFAFQYSSLVNRVIAREPDFVFLTRVHVAGPGWARFLQLESLVQGLVEYEPRAAARLLGPLAGAIAPLALTAAPAAEPPAAEPPAAEPPAASAASAAEPLEPAPAAASTNLTVRELIERAEAAVADAQATTVRLTKLIRELRALI